MNRIKITHKRGSRIVGHHSKANVPAWLAHYNGARGSCVDGVVELGAVIKAEVVAPETDPETTEDRIAVWEARQEQLHGDDDHITYGGC
mgnify:CR=1 FL=1